MKKMLALVLAMLMLLTSSAFAVELEIPREETLYQNGQQWGKPTSYNKYNTAGQGWPGTGGERMVVYEALYMYNFLTGENEPLLADGPITWEDETHAIVKIKEAAHWNDGEDLTADDVLWTFESAKTISTSWTEFWTWVEAVEKVDDLTVRFTIVSEPYNPNKIGQLLATISILPEHVWSANFAACENDATKIAEIFGDCMEHDFCGITDEGECYVTSSGPYKVYYYDETRIVAIRDDNYWGQDESMFGELAAPKYLAHMIYQDNAAGNLAFQNGEVDMAQQYMPSVDQLMTQMVDENGETLIGTYLTEAPWHQGYGMPGIHFNMTREGLNDIAVRKALALAIDYEAVATNGFSGYCADMVTSILNVYVFGDYLDTTNEEYMALRLDNTDLDGNLAKANQLLDEAGYLDVDNDGLREMPDGSKIEWKVECPDGWSDYNASAEAVCESAQKIGLNLVTYFPESSVVTNDMQYGDFDILFYGNWPGPSVCDPWNYIWTNYYTTNDVGEYTNRNYGRYSNPEMDALIDELCVTTDKETMKEIVTEIDMLYLQDLPMIPCAYRPVAWHTYYEGVWENFARKDDGANIPPRNSTDGAAIRELYQITPVGK